MKEDKGYQCIRGTVIIKLLKKGLQWGTGVNPIERTTISHKLKNK